METSIIRDDIVYRIYHDEIGKLNIVVNDRLYCEEYAIVISDNDLTVNGCMHVKFDKMTGLIRTTKMLQQIILDGIKSSNTSVKFNIEKIETQKTLVMTFDINLTYINEIVKITLSSTNKALTSTQVIDRIDCKLEQLMPQINAKIDKQKEDIQKFGEELSTAISVIKSMKEHIECMREKVIKIDAIEGENKRLKKEVAALERILNAHDDFYDMKINDIDERLESIPLFWYHENSSTLTKVAMRNVSYITIPKDDGICYFQSCVVSGNHVYVEPRNPIRYIKYMTGLLGICFSERSDLTELSLLSKCKKLKSITLDNCENLRTIKDIADHEEITEITIKGKHKIMDLCSLTKCKSLQILRVSRETNTGVFPENTHFQIKIV